MTKNDKIAMLILGAAATVAVIQFLNQPKEKKKEFVDYLKERTTELLDHTDDTVERVNGYLMDYDKQPVGAWVDKLYILKNMFRNLYKTEKKFFL